MSGLRSQTLSFHGSSPQFTIRSSRTSTTVRTHESPFTTFTNPSRSTLTIPYSTNSASGSPLVSPQGFVYKWRLVQSRFVTTTHPSNNAWYFLF
ncbi:hypothetical protein N7471_009804 [Penicillium samsonianum]|uniref:uncharacterized protein n=1 Tax=Penicillium samsonianum TaxID=1882272 RepID=UPI00254750A3|nr:uncharacterized protein N7471_009804 [Penicillium samsonianum]KAJ6128587.1 hypothetical protein N7471_009804 [Penicillium samsonianum]